MKLCSREFDTRVQLLDRLSVRDPVYGTETADWQPVAEVSAQVRDVLPSRAESVAQGLDLARRPCRVRMRWRADVTARMRLRMRGGDWRIVAGPAELGRRQGLELMAEQLSTEGDEP